MTSSNQINNNSNPQNLSEKLSENSTNTTKSSTTTSTTLKDDDDSDHQIEDQEISNQLTITNMNKFDPKSVTSIWLEGTKNDLEKSQKVLMEMKQIVNEFEVLLEAGNVKFAQIQETVLRKRLSMIENSEDQQVEDHQALEHAVNQMIAIEALMHPNQTK